MKRDELQKLYYWIRKNLSDEEIELIKNKNQRVLVVATNELGVALDAKIAVMMDIIAPIEPPLDLMRD
jgi:hypothetical protein